MPCTSCIRSLVTVNLHATHGSPGLGWPGVLAGVTIGLLILGLVTYGLAWRHRRRNSGRASRTGPKTWLEAASFTLGMVALIAALSPGMDAAAAERFSVHMVQHLLLILIAPPLIILGRPDRLLLQTLPPSRSRQLLRATVARPAIHRLSVWLTSPWAVFVAFNGLLILWHLPPAYDAAVRSEAIHIVEHTSFLIAAALFWWIILDPLPQSHRISPHATLGLALSTCLVGGLVAAALTFSTRVLYESYRATTGSPLADQRLGGLVMWLSGAVYLVIAFAVLVRATRETPAVSRNRHVRRGRDPARSAREGHG